MRPCVPGLLLVMVLPGLGWSTEPVTTKPTAAQLDFFENKVRPLLVEKCISCHGEKKQMAGLRLDTAAGIRAGSDGGPVILAKDPMKSPMVLSIRRESDAAMPPKEPLHQDAVAILTEWVKIGAPFPEDTQQQTRDPKQLAQSHWAFQPVRDPALPATKTVPSHANPIDRFIAAKLEEKGVQHSPRADARTLIRRAYFDLIGLPPSYEVIQAFEQDPSPEAFAGLVDRLLESPQYGERWGRYWLDLARYSDTKGYVFQEDRNFPYAYTYRDYVVRSFNEDKPYNQFILEQIAADQLDLKGDQQALAAMGYLTMNRRFLNNKGDIIDDRLDVVTRGFMALTVQCARCHDHKYDPIPTKDYYSLFGVFDSSSEPKELPVIGEVTKNKAYEEYTRELAKREKALADYTDGRKHARTLATMAVAGPLADGARNAPRLLNRADRNETSRLQRAIDQLKANSPAAPPRAMVMVDNPKPSEPYVYVRGNPGNRGPNVPRQMLEVVAGKNRKPFKKGSGRLELAQSIARADNPLTARVIVNRVWEHHFGKGLVTTPSDFGLRSDPPSHPELLDWLAQRFVTDDNWSLKTLHRRIMLSATYQQASTMRADLQRVDPENRLLGRMNRIRLDFEAMRDSMLSIAGQLDTAIGGKPVDIFKTPFSPRRTIYGFIDRQNLPGTLRMFDFASPDQHAPQRFQTTVPQQALFLMNSPFVVAQARAFATRPEVFPKAGEARVHAMYQIALGRKATPDEVADTLDFVRTTAWNARKDNLRPWQQFAQVLLMSNEFAFID